jgi:hypothetical protein
MTRADLSRDQAGRLSLAEQHDWFRRVTARRAPPNQRGGAGQANGGGTPMLLARAGIPDGARVPARGRHIAFGADPGRQISVAWQVPALVAEPFLRLGESPRDLSQRVPAEVRALTTAPPGTDPPGAPPPVVQYYVHALVDGLRPGRTYYYRAGHRGLDDPRDTRIHRFRTAPPGRGPFTFTAFGDQGVTDAAAAAAALIDAMHPAFHLHAGDISYAEAGGSGLITDCYDPREWDAFFAGIEPAASHVPWQIAVGNHEMEAWYSPDGYGGQHARWDFPGGSASSRPPVYYSFTCGNVGIVSLDGNDVSYEIAANFGYTGGAQADWLEATLAALRADPGVDFIVAFFHHCAYCTCTAHGSDRGPRQHWAPLFDRYSVDLVINGHNHVYERTDPIRNGLPTRQAPIGAAIGAAADGTTYITAGGGGQTLYSFVAPDSYQCHASDDAAVATFVNQAGGRTEETVAWSRVRYTGYCLLVVDSQPDPARGGRLLVRALGADGTVLDQITLAR